MKILRKIIEINEDLCNGCGLCVRYCAEGAIQIVDGKAKVSGDYLCDGLGACLSGCPTGALAIITREADPFDEEAVMVQGHTSRKPGIIFSEARSHGLALAAEVCQAEHGYTPPKDGRANWPLKLRLVPSLTSGADILLCADCVAPLMENFRDKYANGKSLLLACPKFEDTGVLAIKLAGFMRSFRPRTLIAVRVEAPCCQGLTVLCKGALNMSGVKMPMQEIIITRDGREMSAEV